MHYRSVSPIHVGDNVEILLKIIYKKLHIVVALMVGPTLG